MRRLFLKQKIIIITLCVGLFFGVIMIVSVFLYLNRILVNQKLIEIDQVVNQQSREIVQLFANNQLFVKMLGTNTLVKDFLSSPSEAKRAELDNIFAVYAQEDEKYLAIYLLDMQGVGLISSDHRFVGENYGFRDYFKEAVQGHHFVDAVVGVTSKQFGYYFSYPVLNDDKQVIGVMVVKISNEEIDDLIINNMASQSNKIMLVDKFGVIMVSTQPNRFLKSLGALNEVEKIFIKQTSRFFDYEIEPIHYDAVQEGIRNYTEPVVIKFYDDKDGEEESVWVIKLGDLPFYFVNETGLDTVEKTIFSTVLIIILIMMILFLLSAFLFGLLVDFFIVRQITNFKEFSHYISEGDFSKKIIIKTNDEFKDLAEAFNLMADKLEDSYKFLEDKVKDRTAEMEKQTADLTTQRVATLNILEDVEVEKLKVEQLAADLEKFKLAVDNASDQIVITDPEGIVLYVNKAVEKITGFKIMEVINKKMAVLWKSPMPMEFYKKMWDTIKNQKKVFVGVIKNKRKNGELYFVNTSISPILDKTGNVVYFVGIEHDVTTETQIDQAKTEFVSLASHQLRTPLSSINWYAEMLLNGDAGHLKPEQTLYVEEINRGNKRMVELVNALLNVSRLELGTFSVDSKMEDIRKIADEAIDEINHKMFDKKIKFTKVYDENITEMMLDKKLTTIIFQNLLSNATKYTPEKGVINLSINKKAKNLEIIVSDTGMGIPEAQQDKIFTKLFRADNVRQADTEGTGLGLYLVKSIIDNIGGDMRFESIENKGTTFFVHIPLSGMRTKEGSKKIS